MTDPRQSAIDQAREKAEMLADQICACANREQHRRDVKLITAALKKLFGQFSMAGTRPTIGLAF